MSGGANVKSVEALTKAISDVNSCVREFTDVCQQRMDKSRALAEETEDEVQTSNGLLQLAKAEEAAAFAALATAEAALAALIAEAVTDPFAAAGIPAAAQTVETCKQAYDMAKAHRQLLDHRVEMAQTANALAKESFEELTAQINMALAQVKVVEGAQTARLFSAYNELMGYSLTDAAGCAAEYMKWAGFTVSGKEPVRPDAINSRLNPGKGACLGLLAELCGKDGNFMATIMGYREQGADPEKRTAVELKIRKNMAGRLAEEIVKTAFSPYGEKTDTQTRTYFDDGTYTKTDLVVKNLRVPVILGRGEGMAAREGGDIRIEVKAGKGSYISGQKEHLVFQAQGHAGAKASCTICTHDVGDIEDETQDELRRTLRGSGSPILGMLPYKSELDEICLEFVFGGKKNV